MKFREKGRKYVMSAKLTFEEGFAENPLYRIKAFVTEKKKGLDMMDLIQKNFSITDQDWRNRFRRQLEGFSRDAFKPTDRKKWTTKPVQWTRDERGNIASPFRTKNKEDSDS